MYKDNNKFSHVLNEKIQVDSLETIATFKEEVKKLVRDFTELLNGQLSILFNDQPKALDEVIFKSLSKDPRDKSSIVNTAYSSAKSLFKNFKDYFLPLFVIAEIKEQRSESFSNIFLEQYETNLEPKILKISKHVDQLKNEFLKHQGNNDQELIDQFLNSRPAWNSNESTSIKLTRKENDTVKTINSNQLVEYAIKKDMKNQQQIITNIFAKKSINNSICERLIKDLKAREKDILLLENDEQFILNQIPAIKKEQMLFKVNGLFL